MPRVPLQDAGRDRPVQIFGKGRVPLQDAGRGRVLAIVGPTASGKTDLALALARKLGGEVISADSRQVYRRFDAGTAKPGLDAQGRADGIPYRLVDAADPEEKVTAGWYARTARPVLDDMLSRGRLPIVAGGTGLYVRALLEGLSEMPEGDVSVRRDLEEQARSQGLASLHRRLSVLDPEAAARIPAGNRQRLVRALEVHALTGRPISSYWERRGNGDGLFQTLYVRIEWPADVLRERIVCRARAMWPGIMEESRELLKSLTGTEPAFQSLGYREAARCLSGRLSPEEGLRQLIRATLDYAKRQRTWFNNQTRAAPVPGGPVGEMTAATIGLMMSRPSPVLGRPESSRKDPHEA